MEVLQFIFSSFWTFIGTCILIAVTLDAICGHRCHMEESPMTTKRQRKHGGHDKRNPVPDDERD